MCWRWLEVSVRGGGHNVAGLAVTDGGLMIDLAPMKRIRVDAVRRTIWAPVGSPGRSSTGPRPVTGWPPPGEWSPAPASRAPDELTVYMSLFANPDAPDETIVAMVACHCGDPASAEADLKPLRQFGPPAVDLIQPMP
jgi:FAD binding domain